MRVIFVRLLTHALTFDLENWYPRQRSEFRPILVFLRLFFFELRVCMGVRQMDGQTDGRMSKTRSAAYLEGRITK